MLQNGQAHFIHLVPKRSLLLYEWNKECYIPLLSTPSKPETESSMQNREKFLYQATSSPKQFLRNSSFLPFPNSENTLSRRGWGFKGGVGGRKRGEVEYKKAHAVLKFEIRKYILLLENNSNITNTYKLHFHKAP